MLAFALMLTGSICLAGCKKDVKYYYTVELPEHCEIVFTGQAWDDDGYYVLKDESIEFHINVEEGYQASDFKLFIGSTEVTPTLSSSDYEGTTITHSYRYSFTPTADFKIKATGNFNKVVKSLTISKAEWYDETDANNSQIFIRFKQNSFGLPTTETNYLTFVKSRLNESIVKDLEYGDSLSFDVYYKGTDFIADPSVADGPSTSCNSKFYHESGEIGYHFTYTQWYEDSTITFSNYTAQRIMQITTSGNSATQDNISSDKLDITLPETGSQTITITLKDYANIPANVLNELKLKVNGENQNVDFTQLNGGVYTFELKNPWEYGAMYKATYEINLNFYEFEYFNGVVTIP